MPRQSIGKFASSLHAKTLVVFGKVLRLFRGAHGTYSVSMKKILRKWTYRAVTNFLDEKGFDFYEDLGHSQSWVKLQRNGQPDRFVEIKFTQGFYSSRALNKMIRQSGIDRKEWIEWASLEHR